METIIEPEHLALKRGRPAGLTPEQYDHALLLREVNSQRRLDVKAICAELGISRMHFYDILNGRVKPRRDKVEAISERLGLAPSKVFLSE